MPSEWYASDQHANIDFPHNLMSTDPLPVGDNLIEAIFCSHVIEHLPDEQAQHLFSEAMRILKPGGVIRIVTPDISLIYDAYARGDE